MSLIIPPDAKSWLPVDPTSHFPIQNIPIGLACRRDHSECVVTRIGDHVIDLCALAACGVVPEEDFPILHSLIDLDRDDVTRLRTQMYELLRDDNPKLRDDKEVCREAILHVEDVDMLLPLEIPAFVDFYSGINHASNVGRMFRPDMPPLLPNYRHLPVAYNGRASSVIPSEVPVRRPKGQTMLPEEAMPTYGPTKELDFELELGFFISEGNEMGEPIPVDRAEDHILGLVLLNDWSARDVQRWEYQPLGPFLAKSFATSISPWIVTLDALEPFRVEGEPQEPPVLPHLRASKPSHYDLHLEVAIQTERMTKPQVISQSNARHLYWSFVQQLAHQTSNGTNVEPGDLYGTGTISGPEAGSFGSLLEITWRGTHPLRFEETGEERNFLEDGDTVIMTGYGQADGYRVGFGEVRTKIVG